MLAMHWRILIETTFILKYMQKTSPAKDKKQKE